MPGGDRGRRRRGSAAAARERSTTGRRSRSPSAARSSAGRRTTSRQHLDELVPLLTREQGKTLRDARIELTKAIDTLMHYVGLSKALRGVHAPNLDPGVDGIVLRRPLGVVGAIVPWNFPTTLLCNKLAPALVAGNTVVAKPAGTTPLTTLRFAELLAEGGLPAGVFNVVTGCGSRDRDRARHAPAWSARSPSPARRRSASRSWRWPPAAPSASPWSSAARTR